MIYSTKEWKDIRNKILEEDKFCLVCKTTLNLDVHHKKRFKQGGQNTRENLITLCRSHHQKIHTLELFYKRNHVHREFNRLFLEVRNKYLSSLKLIEK